MTSRRERERIPTLTCTCRQRRGFEMTFALRADDTLPYDPGTNFVDVTGWIWQVEIRAYAEDDVVLETLNVNYNDATVGKIYMGLTEVETAALPIGEHRWDLKVTQVGGQAEEWIAPSVFFVLPVVTH